MAARAYLYWLLVAVLFSVPAPVQLSQRGRHPAPMAFVSAAQAFTPAPAATEDRSPQAVVMPRVKGHQAASTPISAAATAAKAGQHRGRRRRRHLGRRRRPTRTWDAAWAPEFNATEFRERARGMVAFAYDNYMQHAFPHDELDPVHCRGRSADGDRTNININDALGNYSLTLVDTLDTLAVLGNRTEFWRAVQRVIETVSFDQDTTVQVFEANIRVLGGLVSAHILATDPVFGIAPSTHECEEGTRDNDAHCGDGDGTGHCGERDLACSYSDELLLLARDLATRLLPAFDATASGLPYPRVHLRNGVPRHPFWRNDTNTAAVGTLLLEFGALSRLVDDPTFEGAARRALQALWGFRSERTLLLGNTIDIHTGRWINTMSGFGAGIDSFFEYLLKASILFDDHNLGAMFETAFANAKQRCQLPSMPLYGQVDMYSGHLVAPWVDSLQAFLPALEVLQGDVRSAVVDHEVLYALWRKYGALPERFNFRLRRPDIATYPLRPEFVESTYMLYRATGNRYYQRVGAEVLLDLERHARVRCGYATIHDLNTMQHEDRMESFFLAETLKYLYLLFDDDNILHSSRTPAHVFTTEGHILPISARTRRVKLKRGTRDGGTADADADASGCSAATEPGATGQCGDSRRGKCRWHGGWCDGGGGSAPVNVGAHRGRAYGARGGGGGGGTNKVEDEEDEDWWPSFGRVELGPRDWEAAGLHTPHIEMGSHARVQHSDVCQHLSWEEQVVHPLSPDQLEFIKTMVGL